MKPPQPTGYSGAPLWKKLGFKPGMRVAALNVPGHYRELVIGHPEGVVFTTSAKHADCIHLFIVEKIETRAIAIHALAMPPVGMLWMSWPKLSSPLSKGLREDDIRSAALACGLVDIKVCAVDQDWSGLKLVRRNT